MPSNDPVVNSDIFTRALAYVLVQDKLAYIVAVRAILDGCTIRQIKAEFHVTGDTAISKINRARELISEFLVKCGIDSKTLPGLDGDQFEELTRQEVEEVNTLFPFVDRNLEG